MKQNPNKATKNDKKKRRHEVLKEHFPLEALAATHHRKLQRWQSLAAISTMALAPYLHGTTALGYHITNVGLLFLAQHDGYFTTGDGT